MTRSATWLVSMMLASTALGCGPSGPPTEDAATRVDGASTDVGTCASGPDCDDHYPCNGTERCAPGATGASARGCLPGTDPCTASQECVVTGGAFSCVPRCSVEDDNDADGVRGTQCGGTDCDDTRADIHPAAEEVCDDEGVDHDCNPMTPGVLDLDRDGAIDARCRNVDPTTMTNTSVGTDCDDLDVTRGPRVTERCDHVDDDCDGRIDENVMVMGYTDVDGDGEGDGATLHEACEGTGHFVARRAAGPDDDCDDHDLFRRHGWRELCDGRDNDCNGLVDESPVAVTWYPDTDGDGFGIAGSTFTVACVPPPGHSFLGTDCDDGIHEVSPAAVERCNGRDDDCNGLADFVIAPGDLEDDDLDGVAGGCPGFSGDCDDGDPFVHTGAPELCGNAVDDDCDPVTNDATMIEQAWYPDLDGDHFGDSRGAVVRSCAPQAGRSYIPNDCDDHDAIVHPGVRDPCGRGDEDCDLVVDENAPDRRVVFRDTDGDRAGVEGTYLLACGAAPIGYADIARDCAPDDPLLSIVYPDVDRDGQGPVGVEPLAACAPGGMFATTALDCDDTNPAVSGTGMCFDTCNGLDDDDDGNIDEDMGRGCPNEATSNWTCAHDAMGRASCVFAGSCRGSGADCDGAPTNGCEVDTTSDTDHCGSCTGVCDVAERCAAGTCADPIIDIACGQTSTLALRMSGRAAYWGNGAGGVPISTDSAPSYRPRIADQAFDFTSIEMRMGAGCARVMGGELRCWGDHGAPAYYLYSVLGDGAIGPVRPPARLAVASPTDVGFGLGHGCAVHSMGRVACWGGTTGILALGDGLATPSQTPVAVLGLSDATDVEAGVLFTCAIHDGGHVVCWGSNDAGMLGIGTTSIREYPMEDVQRTGGGALTNVAQIALATGAAAGASVAGSACVRLMDGTVACWGLNTESGSGAGLLGLGDAVTQIIPTATVIPAFTGVTRIAAGTRFFCAQNAGGLWCWGQGASGRLGNGSESDTTMPTRVSLPAGRTLMDWCVGDEHGCALFADGSVWCWGSNAHGKIGLDSVSQALVPTEVTALNRGP